MYIYTQTAVQLRLSRPSANGALYGGGYMHVWRRIHTAVQLRLSRPSANCAPRDSVGGVLRGDGVEELGPRGHAHLVDIHQQLPRHPKTLCVCVCVCVSEWVSE